MRVAAIYDLHGNLPALEAVVEDIFKENVELLIVGGDIVPGPMPRETLLCLLNLSLPVCFIQGNGEIDALAEMTGIGSSRIAEQYREIVRWSAKQLQQYKELIASWDKTFSINIPSLGEVLFCHATPRDDNEIFTRITPEENLLEIFEKLTASLVVCGHTHMQFDRVIGKVRVVNAGSLGMPFGKPGADWLLLGQDIVEFRHTDYDLTKASERILETKYPQAQEFINNYLLHPPSEEVMLTLFSRPKPSSTN